MIKRAIYTSGPIEFSEDAYAWRQKMFRELDPYYNVIIPDSIKCPYIKTDAEYGAWIKKHYILPDMADVAMSHHFFVLIDHVYSSGTYGELSTAAWLGKDIVCCIQGVKKEELPMWIIGCLEDATMVDSVDAGIKHYKSLIGENL